MGMGILFAFIALVSWGIGDFLIQKSARAFGDWIALFYITAGGAVVLLPFVWKDVVSLSYSDPSFLILLVASVVLVFSALFDFEALRVGKISVVEPIYAFEVFITAAVGTFVVREHLNLEQGIMVALLILGIVLVSVKSFGHLKRAYLERGVWYAAFATLGMGVVNVLFGLGARDAGPLLINWFTSAFLALVCIVVMTARGQWGEAWRGTKRHAGLVLSVTIADNAAWIAYAFSTLFIPIAIAISVSEAYIALAAVLGIIINKERLSRHQRIGLVVTVFAAVMLAYLTEA